MISPKQAARAILGFWAITSLCGCDFVYRLLQKEGAEEKHLVGELIPNQANPVIMEAQKLLKLFGHNPGKADGKLGTRTRTAIAKFQQQQGLKVSRFLDKTTWQSLHRYDQTGLIQNGDLHIHRLQSALKTAGYYKGKIDGKIGPQTLKSISDFQRRHRLKADGAVGYRTIEALAKFTPSGAFADRPQ